MKFLLQDLVAWNLESSGAAGGGGAADPGAGGGGQPAAGAGGGQGNDLAAAAARALAGQGGGQQQEQPPGGGGQQQQQQQQQQQTPQAYYPQDLPDTFRGTNDRETIDKLYGEISSRPKPPAAAKDYKYEFGDDFTKKFGDLKDDPVLPMWSEIAHEIGLDNKTAQDVVPKLYEKLTKAGLIPEPVDMDKELLKLEPDEKDPVRRTAKAATRVTAIANTLKGLETRGILNKTDMLRLGVMYSDAANVAAFEKIMKLLPAEHGPQGGGGQGSPAGLTKESVTNAMKDPRYDSLSPKYDAAYRARVDADWKRLHGAA